VPSSAELPALRLLDEVSWRGAPLASGRTHALLAALVAGERSGLSEEALVDAVWEDDVPASPGKALQVVVSRARSQTSPDVVARTDHGYRLGLPADAVDALALHDLVDGARRSEGRGDHVAARDLARDALAFGPVSPDDAGPLAGVRSRAAHDLAVASGVLGRTLSVLGDHDEALPLLETALTDDATLAALLRSEAAVRGAALALDRYERHRAELADRLGIDPGPALRAVYGELLAADHPVREGVRFDATSLVGRDEDVRALRALVREARVVSILGPGGLGKTRLAHVLARGAEQQVVHFVELVGVASSEDVVGEVGSALGVRDSLSSRRELTVEQLRDVRARIAQSLERAPSLLVLDNCEHVIAAVADLVAFLVATVPTLRVVTTTRAPLGISAEQVFPLSQLDADFALDLFRQRARAARPSVSLPEDVVERVVARLDGLPLAIELAAAKVRGMSVQDIDRRLDDRFALLRGGDQSKPDRHQTLLAVIDWSWNLLSPEERDALQRLSVFHDGFTLDAADVVLGRDSVAEIESLVDQSLLTLGEGDAGVRYRMLETVREFGRMQLVGSGLDHDAEAAQQRWAAGLSRSRCPDLWNQHQVETVAEIRAEENNLADCLRRALRTPDPSSVAVLVAALGAYWTITGENPRVIMLAAAVDDALSGWEPSADDVDMAVNAAAMIVMNTVIGDFADTPSCRALLDRYGAQATDERARGIVAVLGAQRFDDLEGTLERLRELGDGPDRYAAMQALMWLAHYLENNGDPEQSIDYGTRALERCTPEDGPSFPALLRTIIGGLHAQLGQHAEAAPYLVAALPDLERLGAYDDVIQARAMLAAAAMVEGRLDDAAAQLAVIERQAPIAGGLGGPFLQVLSAAELALARGDVAEGLSRYTAGIAGLRELSFPGMGDTSGYEPWTLYGESAGLVAFALHGEPPAGEDLFQVMRAKASDVVNGERHHLDFPVAGSVLYALGAWGLFRRTMPLEDAARLLVLADKFACTRYSPTMTPSRTRDVVEREAPGLMALIEAELGHRRGPDLLVEARAAVALV
jgi:predicted ATPase/DNA-binding SARP family transcriptional activator